MALFSVFICNKFMETMEIYEHMKYISDSRYRKLSRAEAKIRSYRDEVLAYLTPSDVWILHLSGKYRFTKNDLSRALLERRLGKATCLWYYFQYIGEGMTTDLFKNWLVDYQS